MHAAVRGSPEPGRGGGGGVTLHGGPQASQASRPAAPPRSEPGGPRRTTTPSTPRAAAPYWLMEAGWPRPRFAIGRDGEGAWFPPTTSMKVDRARRVRPRVRDPGGVRGPPPLPPGPLPRRSPRAVMLVAGSPCPPAGLERCRGCGAPRGGEVRGSASPPHPNRDGLGCCRGAPHRPGIAVHPGPPLLGRLQGGDKRGHVGARLGRGWPWPGRGGLDGGISGSPEPFRSCGVARSRAGVLPEVWVGRGN